MSTHAVDDAPKSRQCDFQHNAPGQCKSVFRKHRKDNFGCKKNKYENHLREEIRLKGRVTSSHLLHIMMTQNNVCIANGNTGVMIMKYIVINQLRRSCCKIKFLQYQKIIKVQSPLPLKQGNVDFKLKNLRNKDHENRNSQKAQSKSG